MGPSSDLAPTNGLTVDSFIARYLQENDYRFSASPIPSDPAFYSEVGDVLKTAGTLVAAWIGRDIYDWTKRRVEKRYLSYKQRKGKLRRLMIGVGDQPAVLDFGETVPAFHIQKGYALSLSNVTIRHVCPQARLVKQDAAPSFFPDPKTVKFIRVDGRTRKSGVFTIHTPLWIGVPQKNPYDQRLAGGPVVFFR